MRQTYKKALTILIFFGLVILVLRLQIARLGHNNDLISWYNVAEIVRNGKSPYNNTQFYNYGPWWGYTLNAISQLNRLSGGDTIVTFHYAVVVFLTTVDIATSVVLYLHFGLVVAILYLLNPTSTLLNGFHSQFENFAILFALLSFGLLMSFKNKNSIKKMYLSAILLGLSISVKHIFILFPVWIIFSRLSSISLNNKIKYSLVAYFVFFISFWLEIVRFNSQYESVTRGIVDHVFKYGSSQGVTAWVNIINIFLPLGQIIHHYLPSIIIGTYTIIYLIIMLLSGVLLSPKIQNIKLLIPVYLLVSFSSLPGFADQYLLMTILPSAVFYNHALVFIFQVASFSYLAYGPSANISNLVPFTMQIEFFNSVISLYPWSYLIKFGVLSAQSIIVVFTIWYIYKKKYEKP